MERKARQVTIHKIVIQKIELPRVYMEVSCSKGTYIRTLCHDIGEKLGTGGCMEKLLRTKVERFQLKDSIHLEEVRELALSGEVDQVLIPIDEMFSQYRKLTVSEQYEKLLYNGNALPEKTAGQIKDSGEVYRVYDRQGTFIALYQHDEKGQQLKLLKMFWDRNENG